MRVGTRPRPAADCADRSRDSLLSMLLFTTHLAGLIWEMWDEHLAVRSLVDLCLYQTAGTKSGPAKGSLDLTLAAVR